MPKVTGTITVRADGKTFQFEDNLSFDPGGKVREQKIYGQKVNYVESTKGATVEGTMAMTADIDPIAVGEIVDATIDVELDTGQNFIITNGRCAEPPVTTGGGGGLKVKFEGPPATKA